VQVMTLKKAVIFLFNIVWITYEGK
jgi:hypothetical protein